jgi:hypothetical protein
MKIIKTTKRTWAGTGFGYSGATYGVVGHPEIRVIRESHGWTAYIGTTKLFGTTKADLEQELSAK